MSLAFTCGYLSAVQAKADQLFRDGIYKNDSITDTITAQAVLAQQAGMVTMPSITGTKNKEVRVEWLTKCTVETSECTSDCTITGEDAEPACEDYELECLQETTFKVPERLYRDRTIEKQEAVAYNMLVHMKAMDEYVSQYIITGLLANLGVNVFTGGNGNVVGTTTFIASQFWDDGIWGYFDQVCRLNKFRDPSLINGNNLYQLIFNRPLEAGNAQGGAANVRKMQTLRVYQDPENIETYAPKDSFLIHRGSVAFINKAWNPPNAANAIEPVPGEFLWSEPSRNLPGVNYDIFMIQSCENNDFYEAYKIQLSGLFAVNPFPCSETNTGILLFECGVPD
jgi:hypothetical protein